MIGMMGLVVAVDGDYRSCTSVHLFGSASWGCRGLISGVIAAVLE